MKSLEASQADEGPRPKTVRIKLSGHLDDLETMFLLAVVADDAVWPGAPTPQAGEGSAVIHSTGD